MTHVYSAGGSRHAAVFTAIIGLHVAVLLIVLNDQIPIFQNAPDDEHKVTIVKKEPLPPVFVPPDQVPLADPVRDVVLEPVLTLPDFKSNDAGKDDSAASGQSSNGVLTNTVIDLEKTNASLKGKGADFAAAVRACYPAGPRRRGEEGLLKLAVTIAAGGQAQSWRLVESTGYPSLDAAAPCVLEKLRFNAARESGRAVQSEVILPIAFRLD